MWKWIGARILTGRRRERKRERIGGKIPSISLHMR
jgi:hypothetical protein